ncbi:MAG TPA: S41 family peptidase [Bacteroidales bacterium]
MDDFFPLLKSKYLHKYKDHAAGIFSGWLTDSIGYFYIQYFTDFEKTANVIDEIMDEFKKTKGLVVDIRENCGGEDELGKMIADRFADQKRFYMTVRDKNGIAHNDFAAPQYWYLEPEGPIQYSKPVILITNRYAISEAEIFTLALRTLPHVTVIGDATSGVFAGTYQDTLPNGWQFRCPYELIEDNTGFCWEGIGIPANIRQTLTKKDIEEGHDKTLDLAIELINNGKLTPHTDKNSLLNIRESFVDFLKQNSGNKDFYLSLNKFLDLKSKYPDKYYIDEKRTNEFGNQLIDKNEIDNAILLFKLCTTVFPNSIVGFDNLANAYSKKGEIELAKKNIQKSIMINRQSYPWERDSYIKNKKKLEELNISRVQNR